MAGGHCLGLPASEDANCNHGGDRLTHFSARLCLQTEGSGEATRTVDDNKINFITQAVEESFQILTLVINPLQALRS